MESMRIRPSQFFDSQQPPANLQDIKTRINSFVEKHAKVPGRRIVLVTSGGTTVPLEAQTVRFIDNFSAGTRGSISTEYFLEHGYAVIFLHRQYSLLPYSRHYSHSKNCFLDFMKPDGNGGITVAPQYTPAMLQVLEKYNSVKQQGLLELVSFVDVNEYLFLLREISCSLAKIQERAMFYLAAAVSDFYIPMGKMVQHKIQSGEGALHLELDQVPKILSPLVKEWAPRAFVVSFKLETDPSILISKAKTALARYSHQAVIGNILSTRKHHVILITNQEEKDIRLTKEEQDLGVEIEGSFIHELIERQDRWVAAAAAVEK
ncbi:putative phosphopantothenoylcysteine synthetase [Rhizoclosmatium globosum]|uniref:Putative phosphopantothenoylcysteine synthetase n=1 Tax=Rhizoclosmatium globosum TaxID=329046 RepID=A0A1Y2C225_9FUNG|nr:putative phosphopantothenoylcysteine synthetase [Rhizoclosmatium globosum]|eukprot:ORY41006.1 putative phosphopantothenoylcysteine synthetase [Rhizoclosmatium globosum]